MTPGPTQRAIAMTPRPMLLSLAPHATTAPSLAKTPVANNSRSSFAETALILQALMYGKEMPWSYLVTFSAAAFVQ